MAKDRTEYLCGECDHRELRWLGRCPSCGAWNSMKQAAAAGAPAETTSRRSRIGSAQESVTPVPLPSIAADVAQRWSVEPPELARVLGGGLVPGSLVLLGGPPGVGKSTLLTMLAGQFAAGERRVVYLSAEESAPQVKDRAERLGVVVPHFEIAEEPCLEKVLPGLYDAPPALLVVDSIQAVYSNQLDGIPGSISQIRYCGGILADFARSTHCAVALIGHVTKDGDLAGPRLLEHLVDVVLYFESDPGAAVRLVRAFKNRFGATGELAVLEMGPSGLTPVRDVSAMFLAGRLDNEPGSAVTSILSGSRPFLVEVQALLTRSSYGTPARVVSGVDSKRVALLAAILERKGKVNLQNQDVFVKIAGGLRVSDPAADLALVAAIASSVRDRPLPAEQVLIGEVGLTGELRPVHGLVARLQEASAHGFRRAVVAAFSPKSMPSVPGIKVEPVRTLSGALATSFGLARVQPIRGESE